MLFHLIFGKIQHPEICLRLRVVKVKAVNFLCGNIELQVARCRVARQRRQLTEVQLRQRVHVVAFGIQRVREANRQAWKMPVLALAETYVFGRCCLNINKREGCGQYSVCVGCESIGYVQAAQQFRGLQQQLLLFVLLLFFFGVMLAKKRIKYAHMVYLGAKYA